MEVYWVMEPRISVLKLLLVLHKCGKPNLWYLWTFNTWILGEWYSSKPYLRSYCGWFMVSGKTTTLSWRVSSIQLTHPTRFLTPTAPQLRSDYMTSGGEESLQEGLCKVCQQWHHRRCVPCKSMRHLAVNAASDFLFLFFLMGQSSLTTWLWLT